MIIRNSGFIFLVVILTGFFLIAKIKPKRIKACSVFLIIISLLISVLIPPFAIKKEIMTFDDPESALMYYENKDDLNVVAKVYGKESCMMRFYEARTYDFGFSKQTDEGWKLVPLHFSSYKTIYNEILGAKSIVVYHIKGTQDYYVNISAFSSDEIAVTDNNGTVFHTYSDDNCILYMGYVHNLGDEYKIFVGDETVVLSHEKT